MRFVQHPSNTRVLCSALPITDTVQDGHLVIMTFWKPDAAELAAICAGNPIVLTILGHTMPPVSLGVEA